MLGSPRRCVFSSVVRLNPYLRVFILSYSYTFVTIGGHDNGYLPSLTALANEELLEKFVFLKGYNDLAAELSSLRLPSLSIDGLFRTHKLNNFQKRLNPVAMQPPSMNNLQTSNMNGEKSRPLSPITSHASSRSIDVKLVCDYYVLLLRDLTS